MKRYRRKAEPVGLANCREAESEDTPTVILEGVSDQVSIEHTIGDLLIVGA